MQTQLIALDIDGTLIRPGAHHADLPDADMTDVIARLIKKGVQVILASGRMYPGTHHVAKHLGVTHPLICQQGASMHNLDGSLSRRFTIDPIIAEELVAFAIEENRPYAWFDAQRYLVSEPNDASDFFAAVSGVSVEHHTDPKNSGVIATGIDIISNTEEANGIHQRLMERYGDRVELLNFKTVTGIHSPQASKGNALAFAAAKLGIQAENVLAIGDSVNDVSMLQWAGQGVAPEHCDDYARAAADVIVPGSNVDGVCERLVQALNQLPS